MRGPITAKAILKTALADADEAVRLDAKNAGALAVRGQIYYETDDLDKAIADFTTVLERAPENAGALQAR